MTNAVVVIGAGSIGQAIARRVSAGKHVLLADLREQNAKAAAEVLSNAGFQVSAATVDVSKRESVHALVLLTAEQNAALATTPADNLLTLPMLQPDQVTDSLHAYQLAKRANSLRVMAESVRWGKRGARDRNPPPACFQRANHSRSGRSRNTLRTPSLHSALRVVK
jgi:glycine/D-amino acid oxidase-like deaminating enzyme